LPKKISRNLTVGNVMGHNQNVGTLFSGVLVHWGLIR